MKTTSEYLEQVLEETGGFGRFQVLLHGSILLSKVSITWSLLIMAFAGAEPDWWCLYPNTTLTPALSNYSSAAVAGSNVTPAALGTLRAYKACTPPSNETSCQAFLFDDSMNTIINEVILHLCKTKIYVLIVKMSWLSVQT